MGLSPRQREAMKQFDQNGSFDRSVKQRTIKALVKREVIQQVPDGGYRRFQKEMINNPMPQYRIVQRPYSTAPTVDASEADYGWYEAAARGKVEGLRLAGPLLKPVKSKIAGYVLGTAPKFKFTSDYTQKAFAKWFSNNQADVLHGYQESVGMGQQYLVVNPDTTLTVITPNVVERLVDDNDYSQLTGWRITEVWPHPQRAGDNMTIQDDYTYSGRIRVLKKYQTTVSTQRYKNLIGLLPVIPIPNMVGTNEIFGRPEMEGAITILGQYDDVMHYAIGGNKRQGRSTPVISKMGDVKQVDAFWARYGRTVSYTNADGTTESYTLIDWDGDKLQTLGGEAEFDYKQPGSFMTDTEKLAVLLFYLFLEHSELPEFVLGTAVASSKASVDTQMPVFARFIEKKQAMAVRWLQSMAQVVVSIIALSDSRIRVEIPTIEFTPLITTEGRLALDSVALARKEGMLSREDALDQLPLDIDDAAAAIKRADKEAEEQQSAFDKNVDAALAKLDNQPEDTDTPPDAPDPAADDSDPNAEETTSDAWRSLFMEKVPA